MWREINLNDTIKFKPTPVGLRLYDRHWRSYKIEPPALKYDAEGYVSMQLWEVMNIFGGEMGNGLPVPVETRIQVEIHD